MSDLTETLRSIPLFSGLSREEIAKILGKLEEKFFPANTTIFSQGDRGDSFYLIENGAVQVVLQSGAKAEVMAVLGPRDWFGEMALLTGEPRSASIVTLKDTSVWRLSLEDWRELIEKHPTWLLHFCAALSQRLSRLDRQYSQSRDAFNALAEEFYASRPPEEQKFLRRVALLSTIDLKIIALLGLERAPEFLLALEKSDLPLIRRVDTGTFELQQLFRDFLIAKLVALEGGEAKQNLHARLAAIYEGLESWEEAARHAVEAQDWPGATRLLVAHKEEMLNGSGAFLRDVLKRIPRDSFYSDPRLLHLHADALARTGDFEPAIGAYREILLQKVSGTEEPDAVARYRKMADLFAQKRDYAQALNCLRAAVTLLEHDATALPGDAERLYREPGRHHEPALAAPEIAGRPKARSRVLSLLGNVYRAPSLGKWFGGILGLGVCAYLWFGNPEIGLDPASTKQLGLLSLTVIYWMFWVFPDYGVALIFALATILTGLSSPEQVLGGFASTTWFMTLGVLGLGAAMTSSGLFYRLSLQLVRFFPLNYHWQVVALGFMGVVVMALIPQQSARTAIISQMLVNLSESLGYKTPSKASTGLFVASFLGLGQLGFLFLTGSTTSLIAWGLLPDDVRGQFTWGYWFLAALPMTLVVIVPVLLAVNILYRPDTPARVSYKLVQNQLEVLGPLSAKEWITAVVLGVTMAGWLTISYHGIDGAWVSLLALCVLVNTGVLGWGMLKKAIDWELLVYMGATLSIPTLLTRAKIDQWLVGFIEPVLVPFFDTPAVSFVIIGLAAYALKLVFTSFLTVVTLSVALLPLAPDMGINPWIMAMIILVASEVWFFPFQVDWHTLAYATTEGKGFDYALMRWINPVYAVAYILALIAAIPYWRFLGLMG
ncbi:MAG TPA: SLC13 family permease [Candidatus Eisenbacteria bacterium]|nr:SLC13 family permease [Candidatus Eisenbacteria bacterium]